MPPARASLFLRFSARAGLRECLGGNSTAIIVRSSGSDTTLLAILDSELRKGELGLVTTASEILCLTLPIIPRDSGVRLCAVIDPGPG